MVTKEVLVGLVLVALAAFGLHNAWEREAQRGLRFQLEFEDGANLKAGDSVYMQGVDVGEVLDVDLTTERKVRVAVRLSDRFKVLVPSEAQFLIASDKFIFGKKSVVVNAPAGPGTPVHEGQVIKGVEGYTELYMGKTATRARRMWDSIRGWVHSSDDPPQEEKPREP